MAFGFQTYRTELGGKPAKVSVDMSWMEDGPDPELPLAAWLQLRLQPGEERRVLADLSLEELQQRLEADLYQSHRAVFVGLRVAGDRAGLLWYARQEQGLEAAVRATVEPVEVGVELREDPEWGMYRRALYPPPVIESDMRNRDMMLRMARLGDPLSPERPIVHHLAFDRPADREEAAAMAVALGYAWTTSSSSEGTDHPAMATEVCAMDEAFLSSSRRLFELAQSAGGRYLGWEAERRRG